MSRLLYRLSYAAALNAPGNYQKAEGVSRGAYISLFACASA